MRRFAALLTWLALALACAGGVAMSETATQPPLRHILEISFSVSPTELVDPGEVTLTFTIANASQYDAENLYISTADGLHTEPIGQIDAGDSRVFVRAHEVTEAELEAGRIAYIFSHDGIAGDPDTVNYTVDCPIERAIAQPGVEFTRQFSGTYARPGDVATISYRVRNTGNVPVSNLQLEDAAVDYSAGADVLEVGQTRLFFTRITVESGVTSEPVLRYSVPAQGDQEYETQLEQARILLADEQLAATLELDRESASVGESVTATLTIMSLGNVDFYDIAVYDEVNGGLIADALEMRAGSQTLRVSHEYPVRGDATFQMRVRALSSSGAVIEVLTEPVHLLAGDAAQTTDVSVYAEAVYPQIAGAGDVPVDVYIANNGEADARNARLFETSTAEALCSFSFLAGEFTTHRRVYIPVTQDAQLVFTVTYEDENGVSRSAESLPVAIQITRDGHRLDEPDDAQAPYTGESVKLDEGSSFLFMLIGAGVVLAALAVALFLTTRKQRRQRREKLAQQRRQRQEELGKTNRFTPVKRPERKKNDKDGAV